MAENQKAAPVVIIFGDEPFEKVARVKRVIDELLPPEIDRAMALIAGPSAEKAADRKATKKG